MKKRPNMQETRAGEGGGGDSHVSHAFVVQPVTAYPFREGSPTPNRDTFSTWVLTMIFLYIALILQHVLSPSRGVICGHFYHLV